MSRPVIISALGEFGHDVTGEALEHGVVIGDTMEIGDEVINTEGSEFFDVFCELGGCSYKGVTGEIGIGCFAAYLSSCGFGILSSFEQEYVEAGAAGDGVVVTVEGLAVLAEYIEFVADGFDLSTAEVTAIGPLGD